MARGRRKSTHGRRFDFLVAGTALSGFSGVLALVMAPMTYLDIGEQQRRLDNVRRMPELLRAAPGQTGVLEATVDEGVRPLRGGLVAYVRERYDRRSWTFLDGQTQGLLVRTASGVPVAIINNDYRFDDSIEPWTDRRREESAPTMTSGSVRISGLAPGDPVVIIGRKADAHGPSDVVAESIAGLTRGVYFERLEQEVETSQRMFRYLLGFGAAALAFAILLGSRIAKQLAAEKQAG
jgi:hypothetical protein